MIENILKVGAGPFDRNDCCFYTITDDNQIVVHKNKPYDLFISIPQKFLKTGQYPELEKLLSEVNEFISLMGGTLTINEFMINLHLYEYYRGCRFTNYNFNKYKSTYNCNIPFVSVDINDVNVQYNVSPNKQIRKSNNISEDGTIPFNKYTYLDLPAKSALLCSASYIFGSNVVAKHNGSSEEWYRKKGPDMELHDRYTDQLLASCDVEMWLLDGQRGQQVLQYDDNGNLLKIPEFSRKQKLQFPDYYTKMGVDHEHSYICRYYVEKIDKQKVKIKFAVVFKVSDILDLPCVFDPNIDTKDQIFWIDKFEYHDHLDHIIFELGSTNIKGVNE